MSKSEIQTDTDQVRVTMTSYRATQPKSVIEAYILSLTLGFVGAHHFYLRRPWFGVAYMFTFGLFGVGYVVDLFRIPCLVKDANRKIKDPTKEKEKTLFDAYLLWFPCGLFGFHLFYLNKPGQGVLYLLTLGCLGMGWLVDLFRMPYLVRDLREHPQEYTPKKTWVSYLLGLSPVGLFGAHHYYLDRPFYGMAYTFTFGLLGIGYVVDWFRMPCLVRRSNRKAQGLEDPDTKYLDDIYVLWFPFGIMGFHHFYLKRIGWGFLYVITFGLFGIGWLVDGFRLSCLVKDYNRAAREQRNLLNAQNANGEPRTTTYQGQGVGTITTTQNASIMTSGVAGAQNGYQNQGFYPPNPQYTQQGHDAYLQHHQQGHGYGQDAYPYYPQPVCQGQGPPGYPGGPNPLTNPALAYDAPPSYVESIDTKK